MATEDKPPDEAGKGDENPLPIAEPVPTQPPVEPVRGLVQTSRPQGEFATPPAQPQPIEEPQPIPVLLEPSCIPLGTFERRTILIGWVGLSIGFLSFLAAILAGFLIYQQWWEMNSQTELMNRAAIQARKDSAAASVATAAQLQDLQDQITEQRQALEFDQRPWLKFEMEGQRPPGIDPNNIKNHIVQVTANQPLKIQIKVTNMGKTTAENLLGTLIVQIVPKDQKPIFPSDGKAIKFREGDHCRSVRPDTNLAGTGWREGTMYPQEVSEHDFSRMRCNRNGIAEDDPVTQSEKTWQ